MSADFIVYVDFDLTLYDIRRFVADFFAQLTILTNAPYEVMLSELKQFPVDPTLGGYDYAAHMASYGLAPAVIWRQLDAFLQHNHYPYPDSAPFIERCRQNGLNPKILSFGEHRFQTAKINAAQADLVGDATPLETTIVGGRKCDYIRGQHHRMRGVLIDDKSGQALPPGFVEVHLDRTVQVSAPVKKAGGYSVANLRQAFDVISRLAAA